MTRQVCSGSLVDLDVKDDVLHLLLENFILWKHIRLNAESKVICI